MKIVARITAVATVLAMFATVQPAVAAGSATAMKDTMTREMISVASVTHVVTMTLPSAQTGTLDITYTGAGTFASFAFVSSTCGTGTSVNNTTASNIVHLTLSACTTPLTVTFTGTNPGTAGAYVATLSGTAGLAGTYGVPIVTNDQISVTASVSPSITFDVGADAVACSSAWASTVYTVALGTLTVGAVNRSDTSSVQHICTKVSTNSTSGVAVTVLSLNGASGLVSTSTPAHTIPSLSATMGAGVAGYGLCSMVGTTSGMAVTTPVGVTPANGVFSVTGCGGATPVIVAFTGSAQSAWTTSGPTSNAYAQFDVSAAISGTTAAHSDYADTLTWVATGTF